MAEPGAPDFRDGGLVHITNALAKALREGAVAHGLTALPRLAAALEDACYAASGGDRADYAFRCSGVCQALPKPYGEFLERPLVAVLAEGGLTAAEAAEPRVYDAHRNIAPRHRALALLYSKLAIIPEPQRRAHATRLERACYNAAIARCEESEDSYQRQWDSPMFLAVYSYRCGTVAENLDPDGLVSRSVGEVWALDRLISEELTPEAIGAMPSAELCPPAGQSERDAVMHRLKQKVTERTSSLFTCPRCRKRNHTYRQVQIAAGDEPATIMCTCMECGEHYEGRG